METTSGLEALLWSKFGDISVDFSYVYCTVFTSTKLTNFEQVLVQVSLLHSPPVTPIAETYELSLILEQFLIHILLFCSNSLTPLLKLSLLHAEIQVLHLITVF